jgi:hypothetical protein
MCDEGLRGQVSENIGFWGHMDRCSNLFGASVAQVRVPLVHLACLESMQETR